MTKQKKDKSALVTVRFSVEEEFIDELRRAPLNVDSVVRVTKSFESSSMAPHIKHITVLATALRATWLDAETPLVQRIKLERYCGQYWGKEFDKQAIERADKVMEQIEAVAAELKLKVAAGVYE